MESYSEETLRRVRQNDATLTQLVICYSGEDGGFSSRDADYSQLGAAIAQNTHLADLQVELHNDGEIVHEDFYEGLKSNTSIHMLTFSCGYATAVGGIGDEILNAYQENNRHLTHLHIQNADLQNGGDQAITTTLIRCTNLKQITLWDCGITDEQLLQMVEAIRGHRSLEELNLRVNRIGNAGCVAIATLLEDPNCSLHTLDVSLNAIGNEGASILAISLTNNTKLQQLRLVRNAIDASVEHALRTLLCNTSSLNSLYSSNHTLIILQLPFVIGDEILSLLQLNEETNKSHVAIKKILKYHPNINMEPLFKWNMEGEGERNLKALPYVIAWFERAEGVACEEGRESYNIDRRKLDTIYQFAKAMPLLFVPVSHINKDSKNKRK